ncbi:MAG TPA: TIGR00266 family protein [Acidimicrobiales bacterium]|nr:TIGR00266 family protein [Acidimicrobiales bacterium]
MDIDIRHAPSFAVARASLAGGEAIKAESSAMMATSDGVSLEARMQGGLFKSLKRAALGGESLFVTTYTAPPQGGWVDLAAVLPGDLFVAAVDPARALFLSKGSWLCASDGIELDTKWGGFKNLFGGEGGFLVRASGAGQVGMSCYGALDTVTLAPGERFVVDSGHMVAYEEGVAMTLRKAASGVVQSIASGEGLVLEFTGPGAVMTQTRNPTALVGWLTGVLPFARQGEH